MQVYVLQNWLLFIKSCYYSYINLILNTYYITEKTSYLIQYSYNNHEISLASACYMLVISAQKAEAIGS